MPAALPFGGATGSCLPPGSRHADPCPQGGEGVLHLCKCVCCVKCGGYLCGEEYGMCDMSVCVLCAHYLYMVCS